MAKLSDKRRRVPRFGADRSYLLGRPDEGRDALMAAALDPADRALASWRRWRQSGGDPISDPIARRWLPLIAHNLRTVPLGAGTRSLFAAARRDAWAANARVLDAARPAVEALASAGIRTMLLKGAALSEHIYREPGLRPIGDVDVLIDPSQARSAMRILEDQGWIAWRGYGERDVLLAHGLDLRRPPEGAFDLHWYLLAECCWPGADDGMWQRARGGSSVTSSSLVPAPEDLLLHACVHGLRWSPVHSGHWVADAAHVMRSAGGALDWEIVAEEAARRRLGLQLREALCLVRDRAHVDVPASAIDALARQPATWRDRLECRWKGRPVVSGGGLFVIWSAWRRTVAAARAAGRQPPPGLRFLAAALGVADKRALARRLAGHGWARLTGGPRRSSRRGATRRTRLVARK
jgi:hypothetical protein